MDLSILVPCYNTERYLDQALTSAEQNGACEVEILVLNDGSTDGSLDIMRKHEARDRRVRVIDKANEGYGATLNRGIDEARGTYVAILEPDDWVLPQSYDYMFALAQAHEMPEIAKAAYWRIMTQADGSVARAYGYLHGRVGRCEERITLADAPQLIQYHPAVWSCLYRRDFLNRESIRFVEAPGAGWVDNPFAVRTLAAASSIVYTDEAFYCYREDLAEASSAHIDPRLMVRRWHERQDALEELGITDAGILRANVVAGLQFLARAMAQGSDGDPAIEEDLRGMCARMDPEMARGTDWVSPQVVRRYLELVGSDASAASRGKYALHLAREASWAVRNNGIGFLVHNLLLSGQR